MKGSSVSKKGAGSGHPASGILTEDQQVLAEAAAACGKRQLLDVARATRADPVATLRQE